MKKIVLKFFGFAALGLLFLGIIASPTLAQVEVGVSVNFAPPDLPVYEQPPCPGDDYIWTPGYWDWDGDDYYWVPGTWVLAPEPGFFWTPGYWAWGGSGFVFTAGYWGPVVGFYGGINYGFGYFGHGYEGGRWDRGHFYYNREVNNVNINIVHNTYNTTVVNRNVNVTRVSYNGGNGGVNVRATAQEEAATRERHIGPVAAQTEHIREARSNAELRSNANHGKPPIAATDKPNNFKGNGIVAAREAGTIHGGNGRSNDNNSNPRPNPTHAREIQPREKLNPPNTGNPKLDQRYQQQQEKLAAQQAKEQQRLQQKQEQDHQKLDQQRANDGRKQQVEQHHQQQTQQLMERHNAQVQRMQQQQQPPAPRPPHKP